MTYQKNTEEKNDWMWTTRDIITQNLNHAIFTYNLETNKLYYQSFGKFIWLIIDGGRYSWMIFFISQLSFKFNPYFRYTGTANRTGIPNLFDDVSIRIAYRHTGTHPYLEG